MFTGITQVAIVTADLDHAVRMWSDRYGVGPWRIFEWDPDNVEETTIDGQSAAWSINSAHSQLGETAIEIIQPVDDHGIFAKSLELHEGRDHLHHILVSTPDNDRARQWLATQGVTSDQGGTALGIKFDYMSTFDDVGFWIELVDPGARPREPTRIYPQPSA